jgi:hypothetical protein
MLHRNDTGLSASVNLNVALGELEYAGGSELGVITGTGGGVLSIAYTGPFAGVPARAFAARSLIDPGDGIFNPSVPLPDPVLAVTV